MAPAQNTTIKKHIVKGCVVAMILFLSLSVYQYKNNDFNFKLMGIEVNKANNKMSVPEDLLPSEDNGEGDGNDCYRRDILLRPALQNDSCILSIIRTKFLVPPSTQPYNVQYGAISSDVDILKKKALETFLDTKNPKGFFVECGANDGEFLSNTLQVELDYQWTGLLVEANQDAYSKLETKNRKSWLINACLSPVPYASQLKFYSNPNKSGLSGLNYRKDFGAVVETVTQCFPLYSILAAINVTTVDYFSLDIEGKELEVLKTIPFDLVSIKLLTVEHWSVPGGRKAVQAFLETKNYTFIRELNDGLTRDAIYVHNSLVERGNTSSW